MPRSVERWLETFMCKQYADIFDACGYKSLQSVCQLQVQQLQSMRIPPEHCELIMQNVQVLRQSMSGSMLQQQQAYGEENGHYGNPGSSNRMPSHPGMQQGMGYQPRGEMGPMNMGSSYGSQIGGSGSYGDPRSAMMSQQQQQQQYSSQQAIYHQQMRQQHQQFMGPLPHHQYSGNQGSMGMSPHSQSKAASYGEGEINYPPMGQNSPGKAMYRQGYSSKVQGSMGQGQANSVHHAHPHLRNAGKSPQEVANTILQMASSSYPPTHTVQVPLSKNRSAPYHVPPRSPQYGPQDNPQSQQQQQQQQYHSVMTSQASQGQFVYPTTSPQYQQQQHTRMSPVSPASGVMGMLPSPHSHHSGHSISSSSPCSMHSPGTRDMQSPVSDMNTPMRRSSSGMMPTAQQMASPQRGQYPVSSPGNTPHHQRMVSPVPANQQLQVSVPCSIGQQQQIYRDCMSGYSGPFPHSHVQSMSQFPNSCSAQVSPGGQSGHSISSSHSSNHPSPYHSQATKPSPRYSPNQSYTKQQPPPSPQNLESTSTASASKNMTSNPLQSLQKLCMLPERQVVDPKSVVNDSCAPSPQSTEYPKNYHMNADSQGSDLGMEGRHSESASSNMDSQCSDERSLVTSQTFGQSDSSNCQNQNLNEQVQTSPPYVSKSCAGDVSQETNVDYPERSEQCKNDDQTTTVVHDTEEVRCQPKKMMLLRATKEEFAEQPHPKQSDTGSSVTESKSVERNDDDADTCNAQEPIESSRPASTQSCADTDSHCVQPEFENEEQSISDNQEASQHESIRVDKSRHEEENNESLNMSGNVDHNSEYIGCENQNENGVENVTEEEDTEANADEVANDGIENEQDIVQAQVDTVDSAIDTQSIEAKATDVQTVQVKYVAEVSDSDSESQLIVRKDIKSTYSKVDRMKSIDSVVRSRGHSTGSLSDENESEMEFEDHIGCDDIENDFSYSDEKEDIIPIDETEEPELLYEVSKPILSGCNMNGVKDKTVVTSPHWKKSKISDLQAVDCRNGPLDGGKKRGMQRRGRHINGIISDVIELDCDDDNDIPSPAGIGFISGIGLDNGDGTLSVAGATRATHRQRKTPLKFKDSSFFQGDFIFEDEEDDEDDDLYVPKTKCAKKTSSIDVNHNTKRNEELRKISNCDNKIKVTKKDSLKDKKQKQNLNAKSKHLKSKCIEDSDDSDVDQGILNGSCAENGRVIVGASDRKSKSSSGRSADKSKRSGKRSQNDPVERALHADKTEASKRPARSTRRSDSLRQETPTKTDETSQGKSKPAVIRTRESLRSKGHVKSENNEKDENVCNGVVSPGKKEENSKESGKDSPKKKAVKNLNGVRNLHDQEQKVKVEDEVKIEIPDEGSKDGIICIEDSNDSVDAVVQNNVSKGSDIVKIETKTDADLKSSRLKSYNTESKSLSKAKMKSEKDEHESVLDLNESSSQSTLKKGKGRVVSTGVKTKSQSKHSGVESKSSTSKTKRSSKKKSSFDNDSDYEFGSDKKSMQNMNLNRTQNLLSAQKKKERKDKWADFKGPVIRLEGAKENPDKCLVINDPLDHSTDSKKKIPMQTVTSIHISHLPPDKSVLIPNNESQEGNQWICALCGKHSSYKFLGDLFGPYTVESMAEDMSDYHTNFGRSPDSKRRRSDSAQPGSSKSSRFSKRVSSVSKEAELFREVWVHEECAVWSDGVFLIGDKIYGLQEAVRIASQTPCSHCLEMGAMIGCLNKGCQQKFHQSCAMEKECFLDEENFSLLCPKHKVRKLKQLEMAAVSGNVT